LLRFGLCANEKAGHIAASLDIAMNTKTTRRFILLAGLGLASAGAFAASDTAPAAPRVTITFDHPEKYTDLRSDYTDYDNARGQSQFLPALKEHIERVAGRNLSAGDKLAVTFTDIDLAGDFEPWHGPQFDDIRILKSIYVPRLKLEFTVTDADGKVLRHGKRELTDLSYQSRITMAFRDDPLRYEKDMLDDWIRTDIRSGTPVAKN
jgi:hypothetical protein